MSTPTGGKAQRQGKVRSAPVGVAILHPKDHQICMPRGGWGLETGCAHDGRRAFCLFLLVLVCWLGCRGSLVQIAETDPAQGLKEQPDSFFHFEGSFLPPLKSGKKPYATRVFSTFFAVSCFYSIKRRKRERLRARKAGPRNALSPPYNDSFLRLDILRFFELNSFIHRIYHFRHISEYFISLNFL